MKRNTFAVAAIAFAATTAAIGTAVASFLPATTNTTVWVRRVEATAPATGTENISAGVHDLTLNSAGVDVTVKIQKAGNPENRKGRFTQLTSDTVIKTTSAVVINSAISIP